MVDYAGTEDRLLLSIGEMARGVKDNDYNTLSSVLDKDDTCASISDTVKKLFHKDAALDAITSRQTVVPVVSDDFSEHRESMDSNRRVEILSNVTPLRDEGDGLRNIVSVMPSVLGGRKPIPLVDEPEAFLHSSYSLEMGKLLVSDGIEHAHDSNGWLGKPMDFIASQGEQELWNNVVVKAYFDFVA